MTQITIIPVHDEIFNNDIFIKVDESHKYLIHKNVVIHVLNNSWKQQNYQIWQIDFIKILFEFLVTYLNGDLHSFYFITVHDMHYTLHISTAINQCRLHQVSMKGDLSYSI